ncbi:hypothetical protein J4E80_006632 [Alternaria sp. BMP 0032]|nr:hypothetical protein J4E80_006632 [Alternaria sp. BMP 0032]
MGKNKIRSKDKSRKDKTSISDTNGSSTPSTWTSAHGASPTEPPGKTLCIPTITSLKDTTTSSPSTGSSPAPPISRTKGAEDKGDSVISGTWEGPKQQSKPKTTTAARPRWGFKPRNWWPCRIIQWIYRFFVALTRIRWTDKQTSKDLILTLAFVGIVVAGGYVALDILLSAIPGVSAQAVDGNCSIVYVTVPGPIITISLVVRRSGWTVLRRPVGSRVAYFRFYPIHNSVAVYDLYAFECNYLISRLVKPPPSSELKHTPKHAWWNILGASNQFERTDDF